MVVEQAMWHVNDVVAYDAMRELSTTVQARLVERERQGDTSARIELLELRRGTLAVDGYNRAAVDAYTQLLRQRAVEIAQADDDA